MLDILEMQLSMGMFIWWHRRIENFLFEDYNRNKKTAIMLLTKRQFKNLQQEIKHTMKEIKRSKKKVSKINIIKKPCAGTLWTRNSWTI